MISLGGGPVQFSGKEVTALKAKQWALDCPQMTLASLGAGPTYVGAGTIHQNPEGAIEFVLYDRESQLDLKNVFRSMEVPAGTLLKDEHFSLLTAIDLHGRTWTASRVDFGTNGSVQTAGIICRGKLSEIRCTMERVQSASWAATLFIPGQFDILTNMSTETTITKQGQKLGGFERNIWSVSTDFGRLDITQSESGLEVDFAGLEKCAPPLLLERLEDTLMFMLARKAKWTFSQVLSNDQMDLRIKPEQRRLSPSLQPPIDSNCFEALDDASVLLSRYLAFVLSWRSDERDPLTLATASILRASSTDLTDEALALCVGVEALLRRFYEPKGKAEPRLIKVIDRALTFIEQFPTDAQTLERIRGAISAIKGASPRTALRRLADEGLISSAHVEAWEALRHPAAHGKPAAAPIVEMLDRRNVVHQLFLLLVFDQVGYQGQFTDRTSPGWPLLKPRGSLAAQPAHPELPSGSAESSTLR